MTDYKNLVKNRTITHVIINCMQLNTKYKQFIVSQKQPYLPRYCHISDHFMPQKQLAKMYNIQLMTLYPLKHGGYFTLFFCHFFPKTWGWVPFTHLTPNLISRNPPPSILNCFKITHNSLFNPKSTSTPTSVKPLYFLSKLNFQTIKNHPFLPIKT